MKTVPVAPSSARTKSVLPGSLSQKIDIGLALFDGGQKVYHAATGFWHKYLAYSVVISEKDALYSDVYDWLIATLPEEKHRALAVSSSSRVRHDDDMEVADGPVQPKSKPLVVRYNENTVRTLTLDGHKIKLFLRTPEPGERTLVSREPEYAKIEFTTRSHAAQQAVIRQLDTLNAKRDTTRKATLKMINQWGSWSTRSDLPPRTMQSVILPPEQKRRVVDDLAAFLKAEDKYNRLAIPWHRGYMFHGPPGTGKTSLVKALANEFNLDLWYVSLSDLKSESSLLGLLADVGPRSLLLLEDIDTMKITHDRDGAEQGTISMSSLLNTLDGVGTPHGLVTVMTTNRFDILDPALTRAGRMDMVEMLDYPSTSTLADMFKHFYGVLPDWTYGLDDHTPIRGLSTSQVAEVMKRHMDDPSGASEAIVKLLDSVTVEV